MGTLSGRIWKRSSPAAFAAAVILTVWLISNAVKGDFIAPSPVAVATATVDIFKTGAFYHNLWVTVLGSTLALAIASVLGVGVGILAGTNSGARAVVMPIVTLGNATPLLAMIPMLIVWLGFGLPSVVVGAVILSFFPVVISTTAAIESVDRSLPEVAEVFGAPLLLRIRAVVIPNALPAVLTGVRVGFGRVFLGVIAGEMLIGQGGLGWSARRVGNALDMAGVAGHVVVLAAFALIVFKLFDLAVRLCWPWLPDTEERLSPKK